MNKIQPKYIVLLNDELVERFKIIEEELYGYGSCGDCGAIAGEYHYMNCDLEECPVCGGQLLFCECWKAYAE